MKGTYISQKDEDGDALRFRPWRWFQLYQLGSWVGRFTAVEALVQMESSNGVGWRLSPAKALRYNM